MPTVKAGESKQEFVSRCIPILMDEGKEQKQAIAICYSMYERKNESLMGRLNRLIKDEISGGTVAGDIEKNTAKGKVDVLGDCPKGQHWCPERKKCVPIGSGKNESSVVGGSYVDNTTVNILGSGQTRIVGKRDGEIKVLTTKKPDITTKFNKLLGIYILPEDEITEKAKRKEKDKKKKKDLKARKGPNAYGLLWDE